MWGLSTEIIFAQLCFHGWKLSIHVGGYLLGVKVYWFLVLAIFDNERGGVWKVVLLVAGYHIMLYSLALWLGREEVRLVSLPDHLATFT